MFKIGQKVWHRDGRRTGTVLECDGSRVYIAQDNGAEADFRVEDLTAEAPGAPHDPATRLLKAADITPEHAKVLRAIPPRTLQSVAALFEARPGAARFSALDLAGKLNGVAEITAVPYRTMRQYSDRPGELGLLMGKGLADRSGAG